MNFRLTAEEEAFRGEVRDYARANITTEVRAGGQMAGTPASRAFVRGMAERGWLSLSWPRQYGGQERSPYYMSILNEELSSWEAPTIPVAAAVVAPTLMAVASDDLKDEFLRPIAAAEIAFCLGYSEPEAGSDLFALQTRATRDGDDWVIDGKKRFTTHAHIAEYCLLIARSDWDAPKYRGLSLFVVDMKRPGITIRPLITMDGHHTTNEVYYDQVRIPRRYVVGEPNRAAEYVALALEFERFLPFPVSKLRARLGELTGWAAEARRGDPEARHRLARLAMEVEVATMLNLNLAHTAIKGDRPGVESAMNKLYATSLDQRIAAAGIDLLGLYGQLRPGSPYSPLDGEFVMRYLSSVVSTIAGGSTEVLRNTIATRGLNLPR